MFATHLVIMIIEVIPMRTIITKIKTFQCIEKRT